MRPVSERAIFIAVSWLVIGGLFAYYAGSGLLYGWDHTIPGRVGGPASAGAKIFGVALLIPLGVTIAVLRRKRDRRSAR